MNNMRELEDSIKELLDKYKLSEILEVLGFFVESRYKRNEETK